MIAVILFVTFVYNFSMYFIYTRKIPFFEQFRANKVIKIACRTCLGPGSRTPSNGTKCCGDQLRYTFYDVGQLHKYLYRWSICHCHRFLDRFQV